MAKANGTLLAPTATSAPPDNLLAAMDSVCRDVRKAMTRGTPVERKHYLEELLAVSRMAAIAGEYAPAFKGYELFGRVLGHVTENEVHLHAHQHMTTNAIAGLKDAELAGLLAEASSRVVEADPAPAPAGQAAPAEAEDPGLGALLG